MELTVKASLGMQDAQVISMRATVIDAQFSVESVQYTETQLDDA
jgi:hypothetical protein